MKVINIKKDFGVMLYLWNIWLKLKLKLLNYKNQIKIFVLLILLYSLISWTNISILSFNLQEKKIKLVYPMPISRIMTNETERRNMDISTRRLKQVLTTTIKLDIFTSTAATPKFKINTTVYEVKSSTISETTFKTTTVLDIITNKTNNIESELIETASTMKLVSIGTSRVGPTPRVSHSLWTWGCVNDKYCTKVLSSFLNLTSRVSKEVCWLTCGTRRTLWPYPSIKSDLGKHVTAFYPHDMKLFKSRVARNDIKILELLKDAYQLAFQRIVQMYSNDIRNQTKTSAMQIRVHLSALSNNNNISLVTDESYSLLIHKAHHGLTVYITGNTFFGVRHGLETLTQLIALDTVNDCLQILNKVDIKDKPAYPYRGLMIDTSRNFIPIPALKLVIDGMSYNKMNMFHWHLTDSNSFPFYSKSIPQMTQYGAYSDKEIYRPHEIQDFIQYARLRGVKIIPELDAPAHAGNGWQWGLDHGLGELAFCVNSEPWDSYCGQPPCGQLNPVNPNVYDILEKLYKDMLELFDNDIFHMGGDEVYLQCWENDQVKDWMKLINITNQMSLWGYFQWEAFRRLQNVNNQTSITPILWSSGLTSEPMRDALLNPIDYIIQCWNSNYKDIKELLDSGYPIIYSDTNFLYLDWGSGTWLGKGQNYPYINWQKIYDVNMQFMISPYNKSAQVNNSLYGLLPQILGGEATLWSEKVDQDNMEIKIWPRACALAESLWSDPYNRTGEVYSRLLIQSERMRDRGIHVDRRQPQSCNQLTGHCDDNHGAI